MHKWLAQGHTASKSSTELESEPGPPFMLRFPLILGHNQWSLHEPVENYHLPMERLQGSLPCYSREFLKSHFKDIWLCALLYSNQCYGKVIPLLSVPHFCKMPDFPSKQNKATWTVESASLQIAIIAVLEEVVRIFFGDCSSFGHKTIML